MGQTSRARLRLTVLGCSSAAPHPAWPAAGFLVEWGETAVLFDVGQGVIRRLERVLDPTALAAVVIGHMHADHFLDLAGLRYLFPWGEPSPRPLPVHLPPGGRARLDALATAISERPAFFDAAFDAVEYDPADLLVVGELRIRFVRGRHYVPAFGVVIEAPDGARLAYTGDTGPSDVVVEAIRGADLLLIEAALRSVTHDDVERGHLTPEEAIEMAAAAGVRSALIVHYPPGRREEIAAMCETSGSWIKPAVAGLTVTVSAGPRSGQDPMTADLDDKAAAALER